MRSAATTSRSPSGVREQVTHLAGVHVLIPSGRARSPAVGRGGTSGRDRRPEAGPHQADPSVTAAGRRPEVTVCLSPCAATVAKPSPSASTSPHSAAPKSSSRTRYPDGRDPPRHCRPGPVLADGFDGLARPGTAPTRRRRPCDRQEPDREPFPHVTRTAQFQRTVHRMSLPARRRPVPGDAVLHPPRPRPPAPRQHR